MPIAVSPSLGESWPVKGPVAKSMFYQSLATINPVVVAAGPSTLFGLVLINTTATIYYLKLYDTSSVPVAGSGHPVMCLPIPSSTAGNGLVLSLGGGVQFNNGMAFTIVAGIADSDATVAAAGVAANIIYG
jgi:hypothetical protein